MQYLQRTSRFVLLGLALLSLFWLWQTRNLYFDYDLKRFFPVNDPETAFYEEFQQRFGVDNDYVLIGFRPDSGLFDSVFLQKLDRLTRQLEALPQTDRLLSPTRFRYQRRNPNPLGPRLISSPYLHLDEPERYSSDSARIFRQKGWQRAFFSDDGKAVAIQLWHHPMPSDAACASLADTVRQLVRETGISGSAIAGKCLGQTVFIQTLRKETVLFTGTALVMVVLLLFWAYRTWLGVALPLVVVGVSVLWTVGLMAWTGRPFDLISNIIPTILLVIGIADAVHLVTHYQLFRKSGLTLREALRKAVREVGMATLLTTLTTALGFITLTTSSFTPLIELGWLATIGLFFALILTYTVIPATLLLREDIFRGFSDRTGWWVRGLLRWLRTILRHRRWVLGASAVVILICPLGILQLKVNNYLLEDLRPDHPRRAAFQFFERHFSGARGLELVLVARDSTTDLLEREHLLQVARLDSFLQDAYGAGSLVSPAALVKQARQVDRGGAPEAYRIPDSAEGTRELVARLGGPSGPDLWPELVSEKPVQWLRISGLTKDRGSEVFRERNQQLRAWAEKAFPDAPFDLRITGAPHLLDLNNRYLAANVLTGLLIAVALVGILFALVLGSVRLGLLSLIPNLMPIVTLAGLMGFLGIDLKISTSIIFILSFGIAVDDSIHFLTRFQREMKTRSSVSSALRHTMVSSGKAILLTTLLLMSGFLTFAFSDFMGTYYLGVLVAFTLFLAALFDLTLLPVLLYLFYQPLGKK